MADQALAHRYGEAFVNALEKGARLQAGLEELQNVARIYAGSKQLQRFLGSPEIGPEEKERMIEKAFSDSSPEVLGLLRLLLKKDRMKHLPQMEEEARAVSEQRQGIVRGWVATAHPISLAETERLAQSVGKALGKRVILERQVDPSLIGGARVAVGSALLDGSVRAQLKKVREQLITAKVN